MPVQDNQAVSRQEFLMFACAFFTYVLGSMVDRIRGGGKHIDTVTNSVAIGNDLDRRPKGMDLICNQWQRLRGDVFWYWRVVRKACPALSCRCATKLAGGRTRTCARDPKNRLWLHGGIPFTRVEPNRVPKPKAIPREAFVGGWVPLPHFFLKTCVSFHSSIFLRTLWSSIYLKRPPNEFSHQTCLPPPLLHRAAPPNTSRS